MKSSVVAFYYRLICWLMEALYKIYIHLINNVITTIVHLQ